MQVNRSYKMQVNRPCKVQVKLSATYGKALQLNLCHMEARLEIINKVINESENVSR